MTIPHGNIHHFTYDPAKGEVFYDEENEPLIGYYYEIVDDDGNEIVPLFGPYANQTEVEEACHKAFVKACKDGFTA